MAWGKKLHMKQSLSRAGAIAMKCGTDIQGAKKMNTNKFGDPMTFLVATPAGQLSLNH